MAWTHLSVYKALVARNERRKRKGLKNPYVTIYSPQPLGQNCALLYHPDADDYYSTSPVHFHDWSIPPRNNGTARKPWNDDVFRRLKPLLTPRGCDHATNPSQGFAQFSVKDWDRFAQALGLNARP